MVVEKHSLLRRLRIEPDRGADRDPADRDPDVRAVLGTENNDSEEQVGTSRSLETIERALGNLADLQDHVHFYKELSAEFRRCLDDERRQRSEAQRRARDLQELVVTERERSNLAERRNMAAAELIGDLKAQLAALHGETRRLVAAIGSLNDVRFELDAPEERIGAAPVVGAARMPVGRPSDAGAPAPRPGAAPHLRLSCDRDEPGRRDRAADTGRDRRAA